MDAGNWKKIDELLPLSAHTEIINFGRGKKCLILTESSSFPCNSDVGN